MAMHGDSSAEPGNDHGEAGSFDSHHFMGVRVVVDDDPPVAAALLADELRGELVSDVEAARVAFAERASAGRTEPVVLRDDEFDALVAQADALATSDAVPAVDEQTIIELRQLADALGRTDRIRVRTEAEFAESLSRRMSTSNGIAVHPEALKRAAAAG